jgi:hypothetical protein
MEDNFVSYEEAKAYALTTGIKISVDWKGNHVIPSNMPRNPNIVYKDKGWTSWADFLNSDKISNTKRRDYFLSFEEARKYVHSLRLLGFNEWDEYCKSGERPNFIPRHPYKHYKGNGWVSWYDWLNINEQREVNYATYEEAKDYAQLHKIGGRKEWLEHIQSGNAPSYIPAGVDEIYKGKGWTSWADFLNIHVLEYKQAEAYIHSQLFKSTDEVRAFLRSRERPSFIPALPNIYYKGKGWTSWKTFAGRLGNYAPYLEAREYALSLNLRNRTEWLAYHRTNKRPMRIPLEPHRVYKNSGWTGWLNFLSNHIDKPPRKNTFAPYQEACIYAKSLKIKGIKEWREHVKSDDFPSKFPKRPSEIYKDNGWVSWQVFLGSEFASIEKLREIMREYKITKTHEYHRLRQLRPELRMPSNPVSRLFIDLKLG